MRSFSGRFSWLFIAVLALSASSVPLNNAQAWGRFPGGHHPAYHAHWARPGCVGCGVGAAAVAGIVGGVVIGAAIAGSNPSTVVVAPAGPPPMGAQVVVLPPGCAPMNVNGTQYYQCGPVWYQPFFGGNGVYYAVVPAP